MNRITGTVSGDFLPTVSLVLVGANHREEALEFFLIDSGFNGAITMPAAIIEQLGWPLKSTERVILGDGKQVVMDRHRGIVMWYDQPRIVDVLESEASPALGTAILEGNKLEINFRRGGEVSITALP